MPRAAFQLSVFIVGAVLLASAAKVPVQRIEIRTSAGPNSLGSSHDLPWNVFQYGQQVNITCTDSLAPQTAPILLRQNGLALVNTVQERLGAKTTLQKHGVTQMTIQSFQKQNEGNYSCLYQTWTEEVVSESLNLLMARDPVVSMPATTVANVSQPLVMTCTVTGIPLPQVKLVSMTTGQTPANQSEVVKHAMNGMQKYIEVSWRRASASLRDEGIYACVATNSLSQQRTMGNLSIQYPASIQTSHLHQLHHSAVAGQEVQLENCTATGNPLPSITWRINGTMLLTSNDHVAIVTHQVDIHTVTSTLAIRQLSGLMGGTYTCHASNMLGSDERQERIAAIFPPLPPRDVTISRAGLTAVTLSWNIPAWYGNAQEVTYEIEIYDTRLGSILSPDALVRSDNQSYTHSVSHEGRFAVVSNLDVNTMYGFLVFTNNLAGRSQPSNYVQAQTLPDTPPAPTNISIFDVETTAFNITWQLPTMIESMGELTEVQFIVRARVHSGLLADKGVFRELCITLDFDCEISGLEKGTQYQVVVQATNRGGMGAPSVVTIVSTAVSVPSAPNFLGARVTGDNSLNLMWSLPSDSGGSPVVHWLFRYWQDAGNETAAVATKIEPGVLFYPLDGLDELMTYQFELVAVNIAGESDASRMTFTMPGSDDPKQPESVEVLAITSQSILVSVDTSREEDQSGTAVFGKELPVRADEIGVLNTKGLPTDVKEDVQYIIRYRATNDMAWKIRVVSDKYSPVCLDDLHDDTTYNLQTAIKRGSSTSLFSIPATVQTDKRASVPAPKVTTLGVTAVKVSWPSCGPHWRPFTAQLKVVTRHSRNGGYPGEAYSAILVSAHSRSIDEPVVLENMVPGTKYQVRVVVNMMGKKKYSNNVTFTMPTPEDKEEIPNTPYISSKMSVGIISFAAGGGALIAVLIVVGLLVWRKHRLRRQEDKAFADIHGDIATPSWMSEYHMSVSNETSYNPSSLTMGADNVLNNSVATDASASSTLVVASRRSSANINSATRAALAPTNRTAHSTNGHPMLEGEVSYAVLSLPDTDGSVIRCPDNNITEYADIACLQIEPTTEPTLLGRGEPDCESEDEAKHCYDDPETVEACRKRPEPLQAAEELSHDF